MREFWTDCEIKSIHPLTTKTKLLPTDIHLIEKTAYDVCREALRQECENHMRTIAEAINLRLELDKLKRKEKTVGDIVTPIQEELRQCQERLENLTSTLSKLEFVQQEISNEISKRKNP